MEFLFLFSILLSIFFEIIFFGIIVQIIIGMFLGFIGFILMFVLYSNANIKTNYSLISLFSFCFSVSIKAVFGVFIYLVYYFGRLGNISIDYVSQGLIYTMIGAFVISIFGYFVFKHGKDRLIQSLISPFIKNNPDLLTSYSISPDYVNGLIRKGESEMLEFKSTLRLNVHTKKVDKNIEHEIIKTIVAYLNTYGGTLLIGVSDDGVITGIEKDGFENNDRFYRHFTNLIKKHIGNENLPYIKSFIIKIGNLHVLKVDCIQSNKEVFFKKENSEEFYVRSGPSSVKLEGSKLIEYVNQKFKRD
jgi:hypothetical protein